MPAFLTHLLAANDSYNILNSPDKDIISYNYPAYLWGALGPDPLFYYDIVHKRGPVYEFGLVLHEHRTKDLLSAIGQYVASRREAADYKTLLAYQAGFYSHYHLDSITNPYIYSQAELFKGLSPDRVRGGSTYRTMADISSVLYRMKTGESVHRFAPRKHLKFIRETAFVMAQMISVVLYKVYGIMLPPEVIADSYENMLNVQAMLHDPTGFLTRAAATAADLVLGRDHEPFASLVCLDSVNYDVLNQSHREWTRCDKHGLSSRESFLDLSARAIKHTADDISEILRLSKEGKAFTPSYSISFSEGRPLA